MENITPGTEIPLEDAIKICNDITQGKRGIRLFLTNMQCWGCITFTNGDNNKFCFRNGVGNRGCTIINVKYDKNQLNQ